MKFTRTKRFKDAYHALPDKIQKRVDKQLKILAENMRHPSLRVKKIQGVKGIWEARMTKNCRLTFEIKKEEYILRNIGAHNKTIKSP